MRNRSTSSGQPAGVSPVRGDARVPVSAKAPAVVTDAATKVTHSSATLHGTVNSNGSTTSYYFQYGTSSAYGKQTSSRGAGAGTATHPQSATISGLSPGRTYHFRIVAHNTAGTSYGADQKFSVALQPLRLSVSPLRTRAGRGCFAFKTTSSGHPVAGAAVRFARRTARTSHAGKATICVTLRHGTYHPSATKRGFGPARATVTARRAPKPHFTPCGVERDVSPPPAACDPQFPAAPRVRQHQLLARALNVIYLA